MVRRDGEWLTSSLNVDYQRVLDHEERRRRLRQLAAPEKLSVTQKLIEAERLVVKSALAQLLGARFAQCRSDAFAAPDERTRSLLLAMGFVVNYN